MSKALSLILIISIIFTFSIVPKKANAGWKTSVIIIAIGYIGYKVIIAAIKSVDFKQAILNKTLENESFKEAIKNKLKSFLLIPDFKEHHENASTLLDIIESGNYEKINVPNIDLDNLDWRGMMNNPSISVDTLLDNILGNKNIEDHDLPSLPKKEAPPIENDTHPFSYSSFWKKQSKNKSYTDNFNDRNILEMELGNAPFSKRDISYGASRGRYEIHFNNKPTYDLNYLKIVSPREHYVIHKEEYRVIDGLSIKNIIKRCKILSQDWKKNHNELKYLYGYVHPDFYSFTMKYGDINKIQSLLDGYTQLKHDPYYDKDELKKIYNLLLDGDYSEGTAEYLASIIDSSFVLNRSSLFYIFTPDEIEVGRTIPFSFDELFKLWENNTI